MMGEYVDMRLEGEVCEACGKVFADGEAPGFPRYCKGCSPASAPRKPAAVKSWACPDCARKFHDLGALEQHRTAKGH